MSVKYARIPTNNKGAEGFRYTKNGLMTKESRVPHEVMEKFAYTPTVEYDDAPERRRCLACDAPQKRQRYLNTKLVDLCEYHYQHLRLGQIAELVRLQEVALIAKSAEKPVTKKKKKTRKTALSNIL